MVHRVEGQYKIAIMDMASGFVTVLTDGVLDESPSFAPNGSMIIYATTTGDRGTLATVSTDGRFQQSLAYQGDVREPAWSPLNIK
jgi:TolB protein